MNKEFIIFLVGFGFGLLGGIAFLIGALRGQKRYYEEKSKENK